MGSSPLHPHPLILFFSYSVPTAQTPSISSSLILSLSLSLSLSLLHFPKQGLSRQWKGNKWMKIDEQLTISYFWTSLNFTSRYKEEEERSGIEEELMRDAHVA